MNFLAHHVLATRFLAPVLPLPAYVIGTALPDLLPLAASRVRLRPAQLADWTDSADFDLALRAGVSAHLATDTAFHKTVAFAQAQAEVSDVLARTRFDGIRVRRFFVAHVLTELALDALLLRAEPTLAEEFYAAFAGADAAAVTDWAEHVTCQPLPTLPAVLIRFARSQYLRHYTEDDGVATGLSQLCRRARQDTFECENYARLVAVVGETVERLSKRAAVLLAETAQSLTG